MSSVILHVLFVKLFLKLGTALLTGPAENCSISSPVRLLIQKLFWSSDEGIKIASCITPQTWYLKDIQFWRVIWWPFCLFNHQWTVLIEALLRDMCNARRAPCILIVESAAPSGSRRLHSSINLGADINKQLQLLFAKTLPLKLRQSGVIFT